MDVDGLVCDSKCMEVCRLYGSVSVWHSVDCMVVYQSGTV
jgi:hypothetical protein